jgi:leucyl/phenylalanyl-tRNA--protein transferase
MTWTFPSWRESHDDMPTVVGADLSVETMLTAYRNGYFPFPPENEHWRAQHEEKWGTALDQGIIPTLGTHYPRFTMPWWSPGPRAVLTNHGARLSDSVRRKLRRTDWTTTVDKATETVVERCGPARGEESWLSAELADAYLRLADAGVLHSVEVWDEEESLIGGMFGVLIGTVMMGESGFRTRDNVVRIALLDALRRLTDSGGELIDVQMLSSYLKSAGAVEIPKADFYLRLESGIGRSVRLPRERLPIRRLLI